MKMGLGGLVGGGLGYLRVGGPTSNKTIIGTSLRDFGGSLFGRSLWRFFSPKDIRRQNNHLMEDRR